MSTSDASRKTEVLARALARFDLFANSLIWIAPKEGPRTILRWTKIQRTYDAARTPRDVILKGRQIGMTTLELARDVWQFVHARGQRVVVVCQSQSGDGPTKKLSRDIALMFEGLRSAGLALDFGAETGTLWTLPDRDSSLQIISAGASEAAAQKKGRAGTYTRVHATELAFWEYPEKTLNALLEGVPARGSEVVFESTPHGSGGYFANVFTKALAGENGFKAHFFPWFAEPSYSARIAPGEVVAAQSKREEELLDVYRVSPEQLKWYRGKLASKNGDQDLMDQEYPTDMVRCFLTSGRPYFDLSRVHEMAEDTFMREDDGLRVWQILPRGDTAVIGVDTAEGLGADGDWSVATGWSRRGREHLFTLRARLRAQPFAERLLKIARDHCNPMIAVERNKGLALIDAFERLGYERIYHDDDGKPGIATTTASRPVMLEELSQAVRDGSLRTPDPVGIAEMKAFVVNPRDGKPHSPTKGHKNGTSDDWVFATAMAWRAMLRPEEGEAVVVDPNSRGYSTEWANSRGY